MRAEHRHATGQSIVGQPSRLMFFSRDGQRTMAGGTPAPLRGEPFYLV